MDKISRRNPRRRQTLLCQHQSNFMWRTLDSGD
jgi:hypothetical protein